MSVRPLTKPELEQDLDAFLEARGVPYLKRLIGVPLQQHVTQRIRHESSGVLVQQSSSALSTFTQVQRCATKCRGTDASGGAVLLTTAWDGPVWVVTSQEVDAASGAPLAEKLPIVTRRWLVDPTHMRFEVTTRHYDGSARTATAVRVFVRVSPDVGAEVPAADAVRPGTTAGSAWSALFGSTAPGR